MGTNNSNVPSAVGTNRTYGLVILENLLNGLAAIKTNPYVNVFFPVEDVAEGNTLAAATAVIPGKQAVTTTAKTVLSRADDVVAPARQVIRPGAKKAGEFIDNGVAYTSYGSSLAGTPLYFSVPQSELTRGKPHWIPTLEEVQEAIAKHASTAKEVITDGIRQAADKAANYKAAVLKLDRKLARQKDPSEMTRINTTEKRQGISQDKSIFPKVTTYLKEALASGFTPSKKARIKGDIELAYQEWLDYLKKLQYDIKSKDSVKALNQIAEETWMQLFKPLKKQGGILNYSIYFK